MDMSLSPASPFEVFSCALMRALISIPSVTQNRGLLRFCWCLALLLVWTIFNFMMIFEVRRAKEQPIEPSRQSVHMPGKGYRSAEDVDIYV